MEKFKASHNKTVFLSTGRFAEEHFKRLPTTTSVSSLSSSSDSSSYSSSYSSSSSSSSSSASSSSEDDTENSFSSNDAKQRRTRKDGREYPFGGTLPFIGRKRSLNYWDPSWVPDIHEERERRRWQEEAAEKERKWNERRRRKEEKEQRIWEMGQTLFEMKEQEVVEDKEREGDTKRKEEKGGEQGEERKKDPKDAKEELHKEKEKIKKEGDARTNLGKEEKKGRGVHRAFSFRSFNMDRKERRKKKAQTIIDDAERKLLHLPALVEKKPEDDFTTSYVPLWTCNGKKSTPVNSSNFKRQQKCKRKRKR
ncbi:Non-specific serine/threonine protein kinase [Balamuthia mandrillaris]